ncbi:MAG TPA: hypoxanthine phosphoribosyltransferase [Nannocystaceae bacterium]|nr:hypoxanthine phosphoribosyltransferase [Nannocystaceae bacterium]
MAAAIREVLFDEEAIAERVGELASALAHDYRRKRPLVVGVLNGSFMFLTDLVRAMDIPLDIDFIAVSSYGASASSSGVVRILKDLNQPIEGREVLLVEDIVDTGLTVKYLLDNLATRRPASLEICSLLDKHEARRERIDVKYVGFRCPSEFVVGYGLDYAGLYRNLPYIGVLDPEVYRKP